MVEREVYELSWVTSALTSQTKIRLFGERVTEEGELVKRAGADASNPHELAEVCIQQGFNISLGATLESVDKTTVEYGSEWVISPISSQDLISFYDHYYELKARQTAPLKASRRY